MIRNSDRQVFLIVTQEISRHVLKLYSRLKAATADLGDVVLLYHKQTDAPVVSVEGVNIEVFTNDILKIPGYKPIRSTLVPGSNHFPVLDFSLKNPEYKYCWCIEDDVTFKGNWKTFFTSISDGPPFDFITSHIRSYANIPDWFWWDSMKIPENGIKKEDMLCSFNPIYRISHTALQCIDGYLKNGYTGHHEALMPTVLQKEGFSIADLSNVENHITPMLSFCTLRSMRWKPIFLIPGTQKNLLYHPVKAKENITLKQLYIYVKRTLQNKKKYFT